MTHKLLCVCTLALATASDVPEGLSLVQTHAKLLGDSAPAASKTSADSVATKAPLLQVHAAKPSSTFQEISVQVGELEHRLEELQHQNKAKLGSHKEAYERTLVSQQRDVQAVITANAELSADIEELKTTNDGLRRDALGLQGDCSSLRSEMESLQGKLSTSMEFVAETLDHNTSDAPELDVLKELTDEERESNASHAHKKRFEEINSLALLEVQSQHPFRTQPKELLEVLGSNFDELMKEQEKNEVSLKESFDRDFQAGASHLEAAFAEQKDLNATKQSLEELQVRLQAAAQHGKHMQAYLQARLQSLRGFVTKLGAEPQFKPQQREHQASSKKHAPKAKLALLQVDEQPEADVVELSDPSRPTAALALSSQIGTLERRVAQVQQENDAVIAKRKAAYEQKLRTQLAKNHHMATDSAAISKAIDDLEVANAGLQERADKITRQNNGLQKETVALQANLTVAQEFSERLLNSMNSSASELDVLRDLAAASAAKEKRKDHDQHLGEIEARGNAASSLSMIELVAGRPSAPAGTDPNELMRLLENNLDALAEEQLQREATLKHEFTKKFEAGVKQHETLQSEQNALETTKTSLTKLNSRLEAAVAYLDGMHTHLQEGLYSIRAFMKHASEPKQGKVNANASVHHAVNGSSHQAHQHVTAHPDDASWLSWLAGKVGAGRA